MRPGRSQAGFTLIELMTAATLTLLLSLALFQIVAQSQHMAEVMITRIRLNGEAREQFRLLADGGLLDVAGDLTPVPGYHGRNASPWSTADLTRVGYRLVLTDAGNSLRSRATSNFSVTCTAAGAPLPDCLGAEVRNPVSGGAGAGLAEDASRSVAVNRTPEVTFTVIDPDRVPRGAATPRFQPEEYTETFWTILTLRVDGP